MNEHTETAWRVSKDLGTVLETRGYEKFLEAAKGMLQLTTATATFRPTLFGTIITELDYRAALEESGPGRPAPDISWPMDQAGFHAYAKDTSEIVARLRPSDAFCTMVGDTAAVRESLRLPPKTSLLADKDLSPVAQATFRGHGNTGTHAVGLVPIITDLYRTKKGVTDPEELAYLTRLSGSGMYYDLAFSVSRFNTFNKRADQICRDAEGHPFIVSGQGLYRPDVNLARVFGPLTEFVPDRDGNPRVQWAGPKTVNIGCVTTLMNEVVLNPAWDRTADTAEQTEFYDQAA